MANVVLPNIAGSAKPDEALINQADAAIVSVVGGIANGQRYPGALELANFAAGGRAFRNEQKLQPRARVAITLGDRSPPQPYDTLVDVVHLYHTKAAGLAGDVKLLVGGQPVAVLACPDPQGALQVGTRLPGLTVYEWRVLPFLVPALTPVDVQHTLKPEVLPDNPWLAFEEIRVTLWGVALHVK